MKASKDMIGKKCKLRGSNMPGIIVALSRQGDQVVIVEVEIDVSQKFDALCLNVNDLVIEE